MSKGNTSIQVIGYGNPGRQDDGLGPAFVQALRNKGYTFPTSDPYQLTVEDALSGLKLEDNGLDAEELWSEVKSSENGIDKAKDALPIEEETLNGLDADGMET